MSIETSGVKNKSNIVAAKGEDTAIVRRSDIPESLVGQALRFGAESHLLNPPNKGQGPLSGTIGKYVFRPSGRLIYALAVHILAPFGVAYHWTSAVFYRCPSALFHRIRGNQQEDKSHSIQGFYNIRSFAADIFPVVGMGIPAIIASFIFAAGGKHAAAVTNGYLTADVDAIFGIKSNAEIVGEEKQISEHINKA